MRAHGEGRPVVCQYRPQHRRCKGPEVERHLVRNIVVFYELAQVHSKIRALASGQRGGGAVTPRRTRRGQLRPALHKGACTFAWWLQLRPPLHVRRHWVLRSRFPCAPSMRRLTEAGSSLVSSPVLPWRGGRMGDLRVVLAREWPRRGGRRAPHRRGTSTCGGRGSFLCQCGAGSRPWPLRGRSRSNAHMPRGCTVIWRESPRCRRGRGKRRSNATHPRGSTVVWSVGPPGRAGGRIALRTGIHALCGERCRARHLRSRLAGEASREAGRARTSQQGTGSRSAS